MNQIRLSALLVAALFVAGCAKAPIKPVAPVEKAAVATLAPTTFATLKLEENKAAKLVDLNTFKLLSAMPTNAERAQRSGALQMLANARTFTGDTVGAIAAYDAVFPGTRATPFDEKDRAAIAASISEDALLAIVNAAKTRQIVILNEAHHVSMNRAFAMRLARELRKLGFEYMACEAFDYLTRESGNTAPPPPPFSKGYPPQRGEGYYLRDPYFGEFIREAIRDKWKFVTYEHHDDDAKASRLEQQRRREEGQANNLMERIFLNNPKAKVFIYAGFSHAAKVEMPYDGIKILWMAGHLKAKTGIDPLTIDQSLLYLRADRSRTPSVLLAAIEQHNPPVPFVLLDAKGAAGKPLVFGWPQAAFDYQVMFPDYAALGDATSWRVSMAERRPQAIPTELLPKQGRRMIYAFHANEPNDAVPADAVLVEAGKPVPQLMLPKGQFRYVVED
jgi:hypothetical protein